MPNNNGDGVPDADLTTAPRYDRGSIPKKLRALAAEEREASLGGPDDEAHNEMISREFILFLISEARASKLQDDLRIAIKYLEPSDLTGPAHQIVFVVIQGLVEILEGEFPPVKYIRHAVQEFITTDNHGKDNAVEVQILLNAADVTTPSDKDTRAAALLKRYFWPFVEARILKRTMNTMQAAFLHRNYDLFHDGYEQGYAELTALKEGKTDKPRDAWADPDWFIDDPITDHVKLFAPTLHPVLNEGGPEGDELVLLQGPTGCGKSDYLCNQAAYSSDHGIPTLYLSMENSAKKTVRRCVAITTGIPLMDFPKHRALLHQEAAKRTTPGASNLYVHKLTPYVHSVKTFKVILKELWRDHKWRPQVLIVDYTKLMVPTRWSKELKDYTQLARVVDDLVRLAAEEKVFIMTASQSSKVAIKQGADMTTLAQSYDQAHAVPYLLSINQTSEERDGLHPTTNKQLVNHSYTRLTVSKNRNGPDGLEVMFQYNKATHKLKDMGIAPPAMPAPKPKGK